MQRIKGIPTAVKNGQESRTPVIVTERASAMPFSGYQGGRLHPEQLPRFGLRNYALRNHFGRVSTGNNSRGGMLTILEDDMPWQGAGLLTLGGPAIWSLHWRACATGWLAVFAILLFIQDSR